MLTPLNRISTYGTRHLLTWEIKSKISDQIYYKVDLEVTCHDRWDTFDGIADQIYDTVKGKLDVNTS